MKAEITLRIGLYLFALYALFYALTQGAYQFILFFTNFESDPAFYIQSSAAEIISFLGVPLVFSIGLFGFAKSTVRTLLGGINADEEIIHHPGKATLIVGLKLLGVYFVITHGSGLLSYLVEGFILKVGNADPTGSTLAAETIYNLAGFLAGLALLLKTDIIEDKLSHRSPPPKAPPSPTSF